MKRELRRPSASALPGELAERARFVARRLADAGERAWLVGGSVRDLALDLEPKDADLATAAHPDEVERLFEHTVAVGKAFGTILVVVDGEEVQVTTFRSERGYSDDRRPDEVRYGTTLEEDARRRDFTCNAMYLDPLTDELADPESGFEDLARGRLACVGEAAERFAEDGLRLVRLARFAAAYDLEVDEATLAAARANAGRVDGVSPERLFGEVDRIAGGPSPARALDVLHATDVLAHVLRDRAGSGAWSPSEEDVAAVERLGPAPGTARVLAVLLDPLAQVDRTAAEARVAALRPPRAVLRAVAEAWTLVRELRDHLARERPARRSELVEWAGRAAWPDALAALLARESGVRESARGRELLAADGGRAEEAFAPDPWIVSADLDALGLARGPRWGELLREAYRAQLDGELASREDALAWLRREATGSA